MKQIPGFTVLETLINMILTGFIIGSGYYFFSSIFHQFQWYKDTSLITEEYASCTFQINRAFFDCEEISVNDNKIFLISNNDTISLKEKVRTDLIDFQFTTSDTLRRNGKYITRFYFDFVEGDNSNTIVFIKEFY